MSDERNIPRLAISTPGRICLFGEHQDYLLLPVIPCAISLRLTLAGERRSDNIVRVRLPDIRKEVSFAIGESLPYLGDRDYFRSVMNVLHKHQFNFSSGFDCSVSSNIPISAGTSSSAAMVVSWVNFLSRISTSTPVLSPEQCARYAYEAEVLEFHEPGGMMDQYSTALGGVLFLKFFPSLSVEQLHPRLRTFVLGDSGESKDTKNILSRVRNEVQHMCDTVARRYPDFSLHTIQCSEVEKFSRDLPREEFRLLEGTVRNRDITCEGLSLLRAEQLDERTFGNLLAEEQTILRDVLRISTPKINRMLDAAMNAGALGGKINGSGGGGCMFAYAPDHAGEVADAIARAGGKAFIVHCDEGTRAE